MRCDRKIGADIIMICFFCKGSMVDSATTFTATPADKVFVIKNVPCHKCTQCGEVVYNAVVVRRLEQITDQLENALTEVAIVNFSAA